ncbi:MAG: hypothetical protein M3348_01080 [Acidobacteriota bacterium]|nr:hypothetical protein [Acidobacteriota bacterium]
MRRFPKEFSDLLTPRGLRVLNGGVKDVCALFSGTKNYFVTLKDVVDREKAAACAEILDRSLYGWLAQERRSIPPESITGMKKNYSETLSKTMRVKTAFFLRRSARSYQAAERIGLLRMMRSASFTDFAEAVSGLRLDRDLNLQAICYGHGDYAGPHNDHHPELESLRDGFIDFHLMFTNDAVAHHYLVYENRGYLSRMVNLNVQSGVSIYKLPFWHYTTPLQGKPGREREARRWLLLGTFRIIGASGPAGRREET